MKKILCALLSILTLFTGVCFTGCKSKGSNESNESSTPVTSSESDSVEEIAIPDADAETTAKVITVNIAYPANFAKNEIYYKGQTPEDYTMKKRFTRLCSLVSYFSPDVLMMQEVNGKGGWWDYLIDGKDTFLERYDKYDFVGTTNLAGGTNGSGGSRTLYNQIYYNNKKFELVDGGTFFCRDDKTSPENQLTGDYEGNTFSANNTTTCTYAVLRDKKTALTAVYATTHLCTRPDSAQCFRSYGQARNLTEGLYDIAEQYKWGDEALPIIVGGDFNGTETDGNFYSYSHMVNDAFYSDSQKIANETDNSGTARIFGKTTANNGNRIDYIFTQGVTVDEYKVLDGTFIEDKEQTYCDYNTEPNLDGTEFDITDHLPVFSKVRLAASGKSVAPNTYVNPCVADDVVVTGSSPINATSTKIVFDSTELLNFVGGNLKKSMSAAIVENGNNGKCLRLMAERSRIDPCISIDYAALMDHLSLECVRIENYKKIKVEYRYCATKQVSILHFGASTADMIPLTIGVNTLAVDFAGGAWTQKTFDYSTIDSMFWENSLTYFGIATGVGLMAGDSLYIRSIELLP